MEKVYLEDFKNENYPFKRFRDRGKLSQRQASMITGLSQATVSRLDRQKRLSKSNFNHALVLLAYIMYKEDGGVL
jgi:transcriptional regulator with XRE-family HTH domain